MDKIKPALARIKRDLKLIEKHGYGLEVRDGRLIVVDGETETDIEFQSLIKREIPKEVVQIYPHT